MTGQEARHGTAGLQYHWHWSVTRGQRLTTEKSFCVVNELQDAARSRGGEKDTSTRKRACMSMSQRWRKTTYHSEVPCDICGCDCVARIDLQVLRRTRHLWWDRRVDGSFQHYTFQRYWRQTTGTSQQNNTGPLGGRVAIDVIQTACNFWLLYYRKYATKLNLLLVYLPRWLDIWTLQGWRKTLWCSVGSRKPACFWISRSPTVSISL